MKLRFFALLAAAALVCAPALRADSLVGGTTTVALDFSTYNALTTTYGLNIGVLAPATISGLDVSFPIVGDTYNGMTLTSISHFGGLSFTKNGYTADIENFYINLTTDKILGLLIANGHNVGDITLFDIGNGLTLSLDGELAAVLSSVYDLPDLTGAPIGTATLNPVSAPAPTPEPSSLSLFGLALAGIGTAARRRFRA